MEIIRGFANKQCSTHSNMSSAEPRFLRRTPRSEAEYCEARLILSQRGNPLESNLVNMGASARLPRHNLTLTSRIEQYLQCRHRNYRSSLGLFLAMTLFLHLRYKTLDLLQIHFFYSIYPYCLRVIKSFDREGWVKFFCLSRRAGAELLPHSDI